MATAPMIDERLFKPATIEQLEALYHALLASGTSPVVARGLVGWLGTLPKRRSEDLASDRLRAAYRRELLRLGRPPWVEVPSGYNPDGEGVYRVSRLAA